MLLPRKTNVPKRGRVRSAIALALSLGGHAALLGLLVLVSRLHYGDHPLPSRASVARPVALRPISAAAWEKNRSADAVREARDAEQIAKRTPADDTKAPEPKPERPPRGQVVDVAPGNGEEDPNAQHLAETTNAVKAETRAKEQTAFYRNAMPRRTSQVTSAAPGSDPVDRAMTAGNDGREDDDRPLKDDGKSETLEIPDVAARSEIALELPQTNGPGLDLRNQTEADALKGNSTRLRLAPSGDSLARQDDPASAGRLGALPLALQPSPSVLDRLSGAAPNDHLRNVEEGEGTFLNTREWKYASFFNRLKQSIGAHWDPNSQLRLRDPSGQIYWGRDRETLLQVTLDGRGQLHDVYVQNASGLDFLDLEAVRSFERAQPFPNPPPGLLDRDGLVRFPFSFHVSLTSPQGLRLFRSTN